MIFSGPDLLVANFEISALVVTRNVLTADALENAASRLLEAWPMLSFRTSLRRGRAYECPAKSCRDGFFEVRIVNESIFPALAATGSPGGIEVHNSRPLDVLFRNLPKALKDRLYPRVLVIKAVIMQDATVMKFTVQHAAGDATALCNAATAFCEGLRGVVAPRPSRTDSQYQVVGAQKEGRHSSKASRAQEYLSTAQAKIWWDNCTGSKLFPAVTMARKWIDALRIATLWQTVHFPSSTVEQWERAAQVAGVKVSAFDLFAAWLHMNLEAFARSIDPRSPSRFAFIISVRDSFRNEEKSSAESWNPFSVAFASDFPREAGTRKALLIKGAANIREQICEIRDAAYKKDYACLMQHSARRQGQPRRMGNRLPATLMLTSWSHTPYYKLQTWADGEHEREPSFVQPLLNCLESLPLPRGQDRQCSICWRGSDGGYWLTANLEADLWQRILDISLDG